MVFPWYAIVITGLAGTLVLAVVTIIVLRLILSHFRARSQEKAAYAKLTNTEDVSGNEEDVPSKPLRTQLDTFRQKLGQKPEASSFDNFETSSTQSEVAVVKDVYAEYCQSDVDACSEQESLSAYGDTALGESASSLRRESTLRADILSGTNKALVQLSLIFNEEKKYLAGKIISIEGIPLPSAGGPNHVKVHVVYLPAMKYILKTKYYTSTGSTLKMNKYFKLKFRQSPDPYKSAVRLRIYGRRLRLGIPGQDKCLGEVYVEVTEIVSSRGGLTLRKVVFPKGVSKAVNDFTN